MIESKVLSNTPYTIHNYSNYGIVAQETRDIVDVPYFPAQNLVDITGDINPYIPKVDAYIPFYYENKHRLFGLLNRTDARFLFIEFADNARYVHYQFAGDSYPQGRQYYTYSYTDDTFVLFGGWANERCTNDLWVFYARENRWENVNLSYIEKSANEQPSRRRKASIVAYPTEIWMFGGETDALKINTGENYNALTAAFIVPLNDLWCFDLNSKTWVNYDADRILPHRQGHVINVTSTQVTLYITGGTNEIGVYEPAALWTVDRQTREVTNTPFTASFQPIYTNSCVLINGTVHITIQGNTYKWKNDTSEFILVKNTTVNPCTYDNSHWRITASVVHYGGHAGMETTTIHEAKLYDSSDALLSTKTITTPPRGYDIPSINIDDVQTFYYGGMYPAGATPQFNESVFILNHTTLAVTKYDYDEHQKPTERVFCALAYDKYRGRVWLFGGFDGTKFYNDLWYFDLGLKTWTRVYDQTLVEDAETYPAPRQKTGMAIVADDYLYLLGGYSDSNAFNDMWKYHIELKQWTKVYPADSIPWGSQYFIFEWRDRLWYFNGQQLHRWFEEVRQFKAQPFLIADVSTLNENNPERDSISQLIIQKKYLNSPVSVTVVNDCMFVQNTDFCFSCELETKVVTNIRETYKTQASYIQWLDRFWGIIVKGKINDKGEIDDAKTLGAIFLNVSPMQPLTKNQVPHSWFSKTMFSPIMDGLFYRSTTDEGNSLLTYQDNNGIFKIQGSVLPLDKSQLFVDEKIAFTAPQSQYPIVNFDNKEDMLKKVIELIAQPTVYPYSPWFQYMKYKPATSYFDGMIKSFYNPGTNRIYNVCKNGNVLKINPIDNTFFAYFTSIWEGAAVGYNQLTNKIYAFGGLRGGASVYTNGEGKGKGNESGKVCRIPYMQDGMESIRIVFPDPGPTEQTHGGLMEFDLNVNEMNLGSIQNLMRERKMSTVDYSITREYLTDLIRNYIEGYANNVSGLSLDEVKEKVYLAAQPLVDDLSQFDVVFESGTRPSARSYTIDYQIGNKLYMFGGCECYTLECPSITQSYTPYFTQHPGILVNKKQAQAYGEAGLPEGIEPIYIPAEEARKAWYFDMDLRNWVPIRSLNEWRYMGSAITDASGRYIYLVGGFGDKNCTGPLRNITIYDTIKNSYEEVKNIPANYVGRAKPMLYWMDEDNLMIMFGYQTYNYCVEADGCLICTYYHLPIGDAWIYNKRDSIMYQAFEQLNIAASIVVNDTFYTDEPTDNDLFVLKIVPELDNKTGQPVILAHKWDLVSGDVLKYKILATQEIIDDYNGFQNIKIEDKVKKGLESGSMNIPSIPSDGQAPAKTLEDLILSGYKDSNFRFRYAWMQEHGAYNHQHMFIIGERSDESGIKALEDIARGHKECHLRIWYADMDAPEQWRFMHNIAYEYPLPLAPVCISYDGKRYMYVIYNKYNIWRLDFKNMLNDPSGSWWYQCPPCLDCNFLGDSRTEDVWNTFYLPSGYLALVSANGKMARMDLNTFVWYLDKQTAPEPALKGQELTVASGVQDDEIYLYEMGGIGGKVMNVYEKQWDNFYFDMSLTSDVVKNFKACVEDKLWPTVLRRKRLYCTNHLGHLFYSWLRIDGKYDVEFQLNDFYQGTEIRIYGDYTFLTNRDNLEVQIFDINGTWKTANDSHMTTVTGEIGWDWDSNFSRQYVRVFVDDHNVMRYQYSKVPPNYVKIDVSAVLNGNKPLSKIRVAYKNKPESYNYMSRINRVELITDQQIVASYESEVAPNPINIIHIEPVTIDKDFSNEFAVYIKNTGTHTATKVYAYVFDNDWVQFNLDPTSNPDAWTIRTQDTPYLIAEELLPGASVMFYIRGVNIDSRPHIKDLVIKGNYPYNP